MYDLEDIHGWHIGWNNPDERIKDLEKQVKDLKSKLKRYENICKNDNKALSYIDGHICYRNVTEIDFDSITCSSDITRSSDSPQLCFQFHCDIEYKDIDTNEVIAVRHIKSIAGEKGKCIEK